jgi:hypothetical protein
MEAVVVDLPQSVQDTGLLAKGEHRLVCYIKYSAVSKHFHDIEVGTHTMHAILSQ